MEQPTHRRYLKFKLIQVHESNEKKPDCLGRKGGWNPTPVIWEDYHKPL